MMLRSSRIVLLGVAVVLAACGSAKTAGHPDGSTVQDAPREGLSFRDVPIGPPQDAGDQGAPFEQGTPEQGTPTEQGVPVEQGSRPDKAIAPSACPTDWSKWNCIDKAWLGCTASCGGTQYRLSCNALGQCTCNIGGAKKTCPGMPIPPPLPGCAFCSVSLTAKCCEAPTP